jgi:hypothetical protein
MAEGAFVSVSVDPVQLRELEELLDDIPKGLPRAVNSAINKTLTSARSQIVKRLARILNLPPGKAKDPQPNTISAYVGVLRSNFQTLAGAITISRKGIPLYKFGTNPSQPLSGAALRAISGVTVKARRDKGNETLPGTFIARMKSGHVGVFERLRAGGGKRVGRLKIQERYGPTPLGVFEHAPGVSQEVFASIGETFQKKLSSAVEWVLSTGKPRDDDDFDDRDDE